MVYHLWARRTTAPRENPLTGETKYSKVHDACHYCIVGVFNGEGPPVPIPNTEVKLTSADNTCLETDREDRSMPTRKAHSFGCELFAEIVEWRYPGSSSYQKRSVTALFSVIAISKATEDVKLCSCFHTAEGPGAFAYGFVYQCEP